MTYIEVFYVNAINRLVVMEMQCFLWSENEYLNIMYRNLGFSFNQNFTPMHPFQR
jgi:hypothetical protein